MTNDPDMERAIGNRLRSTRLRAHMSQTDLGKALGVSFQQVQKYEKGTNRISASMLVQAAKAMNVKPSVILPDDPLKEMPETSPLDATTLQIIAALQPLPESVQRAFVRLTKTIARIISTADSR